MAEPELADVYYVEEAGELKLEHCDLFVCLHFSRTLSTKAKVKRRSDDKLLAYRMKDALSTSELEEESFAKPGRGRPPKNKEAELALDSDPAPALLLDDL
jgi:hypothetical protein